MSSKTRVAIQELITLPPLPLTDDVRAALAASGGAMAALPDSVPNPSLEDVHHYQNLNGVLGPNGSANANRLKLRVPVEKRYYAGADVASSSSSSATSHAKAVAEMDKEITWPPAVHDYNTRFTQTLEKIKRRHDPTVTTVAQGVLEWKRSQKARRIGLDMQAWLDRFYMSRIGIRFLIGQREPSDMSTSGSTDCV